MTGIIDTVTSASLEISCQQGKDRETIDNEEQKYMEQDVSNEDGIGNADTFLCCSFVDTTVKFPADPAYFSAARISPDLLLRYDR